MEWVKNWWKKNRNLCLSFEFISLVNSSKRATTTNEKPPYSYVALIAMAIEVCFGCFSNVKLYVLCFIVCFAVFFLLNIVFCCLYHWNDACTSLVKRSQQFQDRVICWHETFEHVSQFIVVRLKFVCIFARVLVYFVIFTSMSLFICIFPVVWLSFFSGFAFNAIFSLSIFAVGFLQN